MIYGYFEVSRVSIALASQKASSFVGGRRILDIYLDLLLCSDVIIKIIQRQLQSL